MIQQNHCPKPRPAAKIRPTLAAIPVLLILSFLLASCSDELLLAIQDDVERATAPQVLTIGILRGATPVSDGSTVAFGSQPTGSATDLTFLIRNTGTGTLVLEAPVLAPASASDGFSVESLSGTSVAAGASVNLVIRFAPASSGAYSAAVTVASNAQNDPSVSFGITETGVAPDITPPTGSVSINAAAAYAQSSNVTLTLSASDTGGGYVADMEVRNDAAFTGNWQAYTTSLAWSLSVGDGTKTAYVRFRDNSGNISPTYTDTITLDTADPSITSRTPSGGAVHQSRGVNITVNFGESMDQSTFTSTASAATSTVYLRIKGTTAPVPVVMTKAASSVTLNPVSDLYYGLDYQIVVSSGVKDLAGRSVSNAGATDFTVEGDIWEGGSNNDMPVRAYDLTDNNVYGAWNWTDLVPDTQEETDSWTLPAGANTPLARLEGVDYYTIEVPADAYFLHLRVLFTNDTVNGTTVDSSGTESLVLYVTHNGYGFGSDVELYTDQIHDRYYIYDLSSPFAGGPGTYTILVYEASSNTANKRTYNLRWYFEPGI